MSDTYQFITGPSSLTQHTRSNKIIVNVFGETHRRMNNYRPYCTQKSESVVNYIQTEIRKSDAFIDVYIETTRVREINFNQKGNTINELCKQFFYNSHPKNARFHWVDVRNQKSMILTQLISENDEKDPYESLKQTKLGSELISYVKKKQLVYLTHWIIQNVLFVNDDVTKEIDKAEFPDELIENIVMYDLKMSWSEIILKPNMSLEQIQDTEIVLTATLLDIYALARMFKLFENIKTNQTFQAQNIILYAGEVHARNIRYALKCLHFILTHSLIASDTSCLHIPLNFKMFMK